MSLTDWAMRVVGALGAPGAGLLVAAENLFPPLPSELFLPLAGFAVAQGRINLFAAIGFTTLGSVLGALLLYALGAKLGADRLRALADRMPLMEPSDVDKAEEWFDRHGNKAVLFGRMVPLVRSLISIPAGVRRMPVVAFTALTTAGSLVWNTGLILAGYALGASWHLVEGYASWIEYGLLAVLVGVVAWGVVKRVRRRRRQGRPHGR